VAYTTPRWKGLNGYARFLLLANSPKVSLTLPEGYAEALCERYSAFSNHTKFVHVYDFAKEYEKRIVAQNAVSTALFGGLTENFQSMLIRPIDTPMLFFNWLKICRSPGSAFLVKQLPVRTLGGWILLDCRFHFDPESYLLVFQEEPN
jgi:hypothetical protein